MTTTPTQAARVRSLVDHPIIDADGHFVELGTAAPRRGDQLRRGRRRRGAARAVPRAPRARSTRRRASPTAAIPTCATSGRRCRRGGDGRRPEHARPRHVAPARAALRAARRDRHRLHDPLPVDGARRTSRSTDEELSSVRVPRGEPLSRNACSRRTATACTVGALDPDEHTRAGRRRGRVRGDASSGAKSVLMAGVRAPSPGRGSGRVPPRHVRPRQRLRLRPVLGEVRGARRRAGGAQLVAAAPGHAVDLELRVQPRRRAGGRATSRCASRCSSPG